MTLVWKDLNIEVRNNNANITSDYVELIQCSSGSVKKGELLAIMGPSGGGKTTLLKMLAGHIPSGSITQGEVFFNNEPRNDTWMKKIGFVDQDDMIYEDLTIEETIRYAGKFRNPNYTEAWLKSVIKDLGLDGVSKNKMKKISGGQRKRTMIAVELIADPEILFLDEPTSGLDAITALKLIEMLKTLAKEKNKIVLISIHQPSEQIFHVFDQIMLIADTKQVYYGETSKIEDYFKEKGIIRQNFVSLPDFIILICDKDYQKANSSVIYTEQNLFEGKTVDKGRDIAINDNEFVLNYMPNFKHVLLLVLRRISMISHRKYPFFKGQLIKAIIYGVVLLAIAKGLSMKESNPNDKDGLLMVTVAFVSSCGIYFNLMQVIASSTSVYEDHAIIKREIKLETYSTGSYFISLVFYQAFVELLVPILLFFPILYLSKCYSITLLLMFLLTPFISVAFGLTLGAIVNIRVVQTFIGIFFGIISSPDSLNYTIILFKLRSFTPEKYRKIFYLSYLLILFPTVHFRGLLQYINFMGLSQEDNKRLIEKENADKSLGELNIVNHVVEIQEYYINFHHTGFFLILLMFLGSYLFILLGGITLFGLNTMPERRIKLQKSD